MSSAAKRFPVLLYDRDARAAYKKGGLAAKARDVANAGRYDDTHLVHVTDDELNMLRQQWGEPTINPETGIPEYGLFGSLFKVFKKVAPIAVSFIPGVGPIAGAALGAGLGALDGGGLKGALIGGATGALGGSGAAGKIGGGILGKGASAAAKGALGNAIIGGATGALTGQDPLQSALMAGGTSFLGSKLAGNGNMQSQQAADASLRSGTPGIGDFAAKQTAASAAGQAAAPATTMNTTAPTTGTSPNWWNRDVGFLGKMGADLGIKNKHAVLAGGLLAGSLLGKGEKDEKMPTRDEFFGSSFGNSMGAPGGFKLASVSSGVAPESAAAEYSKRYLQNYATGGNVGSEGQSSRGSFAVEGPGTGREDKIQALLSDGEYVIDAETVAMLGDGSSKAGAKALDDFRVKIRKHKGKKLAKGKFSANAKKPEAYMRGGRI